MHTVANTTCMDFKKLGRWKGHNFPVSSKSPCDKESGHLANPIAQATAALWKSKQMSMCNMHCVILDISKQLRNTASEDRESVSAALWYSGLPAANCRLLSFCWTNEYLRKYE